MREHGYVHMYTDIYLQNYWTLCGQDLGIWGI